MALTVPRYTVADLDLLPDDGNRYEVLAGTLLVTPSPGSAHQGAVARLSALFASHILARRRSGAGRVVRDALTWSAPHDDLSVRVELSELFSDIV